MANLRVIDVSEHQGTINWDAVKGHIDGAILRCGYGDNIASQDDKQWKRTADECTRLGIPFRDISIPTRQVTHRREAKRNTSLD